MVRCRKLATSSPRASSPIWERVSLMRILSARRGGIFSLPRRNAQVGGAALHDADDKRQARAQEVGLANRRWVQGAEQMPVPLDHRRQAQGTRLWQQALQVAADDVRQLGDGVVDQFRAEA